MQDQLFDMTGKVCLVTGASAGLGAHFTQVLSDRGASVVGMSRTPSGERASERVAHVVGDVRNSADIEAALDFAEETFGPVDVVVNNAGAHTTESISKVDATDAATVFETNVTAAALVSQEAAARMRQAGTGGSIIHISSTLSNAVMPSLAIYASSKAALEHLMHHQAKAWARSGIRVNALSPGWFATDMTREAFDRGLREIVRAQTPMRRIGNHEDLDGALLLLASDASRFMTGSVITVDGGYSLIS